MKDYKDREQQRAADERWNKSTRPPGKEELDPRVYGRYDDKADDRKRREEDYRERKQIIKRFNRRQEREDYYNHVKTERRSPDRSGGIKSRRSRSRSESPRDRRETKFNRSRRRSDSDMSD